MKIEKVNQDKVSIHAETKINKQNVLVGSLKPHKNHKLYQFNTITKEVTLAKFERVGVAFNDLVKGVVSDRKKVVIVENCIYRSFLNEKTAIKKFNKI